MIRYDVTVAGPLFTADIQRRFDARIVGFLADVSARGQALVTAGTPVGATGLARGGVFSEVRGKPAAREGIVASSVYYMPIVDQGRAPGRRPPGGPILLWVTRKLGLVGGQARSAAFAIAGQIGREGTSGARNFQNAEPAIRGYAVQRGQALGADLARELGGGV